MLVIFNNHLKTDLIMAYSHNNREKQEEMMHRLDIDEQVKEWQKTNSGNPPRFGSRIEIKGYRKSIDKLNIINLPKK